MVLSRAQSGRARFSAFAVAAFFAFAAQAHRGEAKRDLRLQLNGTQLEGLLSYSLPPGRAAQRVLAVPPGLIPGERTDQPLEEVLGARVAAEALRGISVSYGSDAEHLAHAKLTLVEAKARKAQSGGLEALLLVRVEGQLPAPGLLELASTALPRVRVLLTAVNAGSLALVSGVGKADAEGLALRPREGLACRIGIGRPAHD